MSVIIDIRDDRGRFLTRPTLDDETFGALLTLAKLQGISFEELVRRAVHEHIERALK